LFSNQSRPQLGGFFIWRSREKNNFFNTGDTEGQRVERNFRWAEWAYRSFDIGHLVFMEFRTLGHSGLKVPVLSFGTGTFGGGNDFFRAWGSTDVAEAKRLVDICLEAGVNLFDTADIYSDGLSEKILGKAIAGRRDEVLISTKATFRMIWDRRAII
jgi:hypothetical protein